MKDSSQIPNIMQLAQRVTDLENFFNFYSDEEIIGVTLRLKSKDDSYDVEVHNLTPLFNDLIGIVNKDIHRLLERIERIVNDNHAGIVEQIKYEEL